MIQRVTVRHLRNLSHLSLALEPGLTVLVGDNGQGKTSILEALYVLATGTSPRAPRLRDLVQAGEAGFSVTAAVVEAGVGHTLSAQYAVGASLVRSVDRRRWRAAQGEPFPLLAVYFCPDDLLLVKGSPAYRRRFLDTELGQVSPRYQQELARYRRALAQRNRLLREVRWQAQHEALLRAFDEELVDAGSYVARWRQEAFARFAPLFQEAVERLAEGARVQVRWEPALGGQEPTREGFAAALAKYRQEERRRGATLVGPHRDELAVELHGRSSRVFASQGEQRTLAVAFKAAALQFIRERTGREPVLLLDDVLSELDPSRRGRLLQLLPAGQVLLTTTSTEDLPAPLDRARCLRIQGGSLVQGEITHATAARGALADPGADGAAPEDP